MVHAFLLWALLGFPLFADLAWSIRLAKSLMHRFTFFFVATCWRYIRRAFRLPPILLCFTGFLSLFSAFVDVDTLQCSIRLYSSLSKGLIFFFFILDGRFCARLLLSRPRPTEVLFRASAGRSISLNR